MMNVESTKLLLIENISLKYKFPIEQLLSQNKLILIYTEKVFWKLKTGSIFLTSSFLRNYSNDFLSLETHKVYYSVCQY